MEPKPACASPSSAWPAAPPAAAALLGAEHAILQRQDALQSAFNEFYPRLLDHFSTFPDLHNGPGSG
jgi:hypothetical protein